MHQQITPHRGWATCTAKGPPASQIPSCPDVLSEGCVSYWRPSHLVLADIRW